MARRLAEWLESWALRLNGGVHGLRCRERTCPCWQDGKEDR